MRVEIFNEMKIITIPNMLGPGAWTHDRMNYHWKGIGTGNNST